jgi:hypothetical protein
MCAWQKHQALGSIEAVLHPQAEEKLMARFKYMPEIAEAKTLEQGKIYLAQDVSYGGLPLPWLRLRKDRLAGAFNAALERRAGRNLAVTGVSPAAHGFEFVVDGDVSARALQSALRSVARGKTPLSVFRVSL